MLVLAALVLAVKKKKKKQEYNDFVNLAELLFAAASYLVTSRCDWKERNY